MFAIRCPRHGSRVLLALDAVEDLSQHDGCLAVTFRCTCGYRGRWHSRVDRHRLAAPSA